MSKVIHALVLWCVAKLMYVIQIGKKFPDFVQHEPCGEGLNYYVIQIISYHDVF